MAAAPARLVEGRLPEGPDDDVAVLVARVHRATSASELTLAWDDGELSVAEARRTVAKHLGRLGVSPASVDDANLVTSELLTNAAQHAVPPLQLRVLAEEGEIRIEVHDHASYEPRKQRPDSEDEHGRGLQIVAALSERWGTRPTDRGKAVWCVLASSEQ